jgi:1-acyl-sn-glycerol-3-phosphate acyltransferase
MNDRLADLYYEVNFWISMLGMTAGFSLRTEGHRNVPQHGPALLIANHQSFMDPIIIGLAARRPLRFLARRTLFDNRVVKWLIHSFRGVPINQEGFAREGLKAILEQLQAGQAVVIFPEGERTPHGALQPLRPGIHLLIKRMDMPIVPVGIAGAYDAWPRWRPLPIPAPLMFPAGKGTIAASIGRPLPSRMFADWPRDRVLEELFVVLQKQAERAERLRRKV